MWIVCLLLIWFFIRLVIIIGIFIKNVILFVIIKDMNVLILEEKLKILEVVEVCNRFNLLIKNNVIIKILFVLGLKKLL